MAKTALTTSTGGRDDLFGGNGPDGLYGGLGRDDLTGGPGRDDLTGGAGRDDLTGGPGRDDLTGGPGRAGFTPDPALTSTGGRGALGRRTTRATSTMESHRWSVLIGLRGVARSDLDVGGEAISLPEGI